jgi:uncharacterized protein YdiU (UPF0061 family)
MSKKGTISGQWISGTKKIKCNLFLLIFEEDNNIITYCPALDLSGYGVTEEEAKKSFEVTLSEYFRYTTKKGTLAEDLKKLGWKIRKDLNKKPVPPTMENLLSKNEDFSRIFNSYDFHKRSTIINMPAIA